MNVAVRRPLNGKAQIRIAAPPERAWDLISDVSRMGEWSRECRRCEWIGGDAIPEVGARFRGYNRIGPWRWSREALITASDRGRVFAFVTTGVGNAEQTRWRYRFFTDRADTVVEESFEGVTRPLYLHVLLSIPRAAYLRKKQIERGMRRTLERVKAEAEGGR